MADDKKWPEYYPGHTMNCKCILHGLDDVTVAQLKAIAEELDRQMMEPLNTMEPGNMIHYYHNLEGHFEKKH